MFHPKAWPVGGHDRGEQSSQKAGSLPHDLALLEAKGDLALGRLGAV